MNKWPDAISSSLDSISIAATTTSLLSQINQRQYTFTPVAPMLWNLNPDTLGLELMITDVVTNETLTSAFNSYDTSTTVTTKFANLIDSAPATLNTLKEFASAVNNDPNYASVVQSQIGSNADTANFPHKETTCPGQPMPCS